MYIYIHDVVYTDTGIYTMYTNVCMYTYVCVRVYIYIYIYICMSIYIYTHNLFVPPTSLPLLLFARRGEHHKIIDSLCCIHYEIDDSSVRPCESNGNKS